MALQDKNVKRKSPFIEEDDELLLLMARELGVLASVKPQAAPKQSKTKEANGGSKAAPFSDFIPRLTQRVQEVPRSLVKDKWKSLVAPTLTPHGNPLNHRSFDRFVFAHRVSMAPPTLTLSRDPKARSLTFDPYLLPFVFISPKIILKDHLETISLLGV